MTRFRPSVESLDARALPSAVFATADEPAEVVATARTTTPPATPPLKIVLSDVLISNYSAAPAAPETPATGGAEGEGAVAKVTFQDFHFTAKVSKPSPK